MRAHAIVIGIDGYKKPEWCLTGAVRDAVAFARWAVKMGNVHPDDLTLLLTQREGDTPLADQLGSSALAAQAKPATREAIKKVFQTYEGGIGGEVDRLWFYYAGHGLAPPGDGPSAGPLVVPCDIDNLDTYVRYDALGLEDFREAMQDRAPKEQFYFIDACRDVLQPKGNKVLTHQFFWDVQKLDDKSLATQAIFPATTAGQKSRELRSKGLFSRALMKALSGLGPELKGPDAPTPPGIAPRRRLLFDELVRFVNHVVSWDLQNILGIEQSEIKGLPDARVNHLNHPIAVVEFASEDIPKAKLTAILETAAARGSARIVFLQWNDNDGRWETRPDNPKPIGPPVEESTTFELRGGRHSFECSAPGFVTKQENVLLFEDKRIAVDLERAAEATVELAPATRGDVLESVRESIPEFRPTTGAIHATSKDPLARISVIDGGDKERGRAYHRLYLSGLSPGPYRVVVELTSAQRAEQIVQVRAGETATPQLVISGPPLDPTLAQALTARGMRVDANYASPSENFGEAVANPRLGSILAYAAWAARWPSSQGFMLLREIGVDRLPNLANGQSAVQVLVGDIAAEGSATVDEIRVRLESPTSDGAPLATPPGKTIIIDGDIAQISGRSEGLGPMELSPLQGLPFARQGSAVIAPGPIRVRVEMPGFVASSFAVVLLPGFVTVLVVAREGNGEVDVQQYLNPIDPMAQIAPGFAPPMKDDIRLVEIGWRALQRRDVLDSIEYNGLIEGKRSNPLLGIIAGYRMVGTGREHEFRVLEQQPVPPRITDSALWNLVQLFPMLPDVHVLAGLYDPERRDEHFSRAIKTGTPILVEGFWTLVNWLTQTAIEEGRFPPTLGHSVLPGSVWTGFIQPSPAPRVESVRIVPTGGRPYLGDRSNQQAVLLAGSVGRLDPEGGSGAFLCSAFLVTQWHVVCPIHFALKFGRELADGSWTMNNPIQVRFDLADPSGDRRVARAVRTLRPPKDAAIAQGSLTRETLEQCWPVLLELSEPVSAAALKVGTAAPKLAQRAAVIGFPRDDARIPSAEFARHFVGSAGEKHFMTGTVLRPPGNTWTLDYDCFTADGTSGGPVVDLDTLEVIGMHVAGYKPPDGRKRGVAVWLGPFASQLAKG